MLKKSITAILVLAAAFWMQTASASAQQNQQASAATQSGTDQDIQLLRQDLRSQKKQIIAANMPLTDVEAPSSGRFTINIRRRSPRLVMTARPLSKSTLRVMTP